MKLSNLGRTFQAESITFKGLDRGVPDSVMDNLQLRLSGVEVELCGW